MTQSTVKEEAAPWRRSTWSAGHGGLDVEGWPAKLSTDNARKGETVYDSMVDINPEKGSMAQKTRLIVSVIVLLSFGPVVMGAFGTYALVDAIRLEQARQWPIVEASLERCNIYFRMMRGHTHWEIEATWHYGENSQKRYSDVWSPSDAPRPSGIRADDNEYAAMIARYCQSPEIKQLRVSPSDPDLARPNMMVMQADLKTGLIIASIIFAPGLMYFILGIAVLIYNKRKALRDKPRWKVPKIAVRP